MHIIYLILFLFALCSCNITKQERGVSANKKNKRIELTEKEEVQFKKLFFNANKEKVLGNYETAIELLSPIADKFEKLEKIFICGNKDNIPDKIGQIPCEKFEKFYTSDDSNPEIELSIKDKERCMFTSGTTGMPKGVVREHGGVLMTVRSYIQHQGIKNKDVLMSVLSLGHANAQAMC